jgi:hypothetical protein
MIPPWVVEEMRSVDLHDKRLDERLRTVLSMLADRPAASIPEACGGRTEMTAAYRFFDNEKADFQAILKSHREATDKRIAAQAVAILVQDTTEIDLTREVPVKGTGPLDGSRRGVLLHLLHAFTRDGTPLGTVEAEAWTRGEEPINAHLTRAQRIATPIEEKESLRWVTTLELARQAAARSPATQCICVADSEADIYEVLDATTVGGVDWIIRAAQNRALLQEEDSDLNLLRERVAESPELSRHTIHVRGRKLKLSCETRGRRQPRESRVAEVAVRAKKVTLRPPHRPDRELAAVTLSAVLVAEVSPPPGEEPVEWLLLTNLPIDDLEQVRQVIEYYCLRWMIEVFFRVLKSGCRIEERRFDVLDRVLACLAVYLIVAWRTLYVCRLGRSYPDIDCEAVFEPAEWKATWKIVKGQDPPKTPPKLGVMVKLVARLGGYVERPKSPPGPQTLWIGLQRVHDFATCWEKFGPESRRRRRDV